MERNMSLNEDVLRHMVVRVETLQEGPSAVLQNRGERDRDRGDRRGRFEGGGGGGRFDSGRPPRGPAPSAGNEGETA
jgi:small subunit ribosomal protein S6